MKDYANGEVTSSSKFEKCPEHGFDNNYQQTDGQCDITDHPIPFLTIHHGPRSLSLGLINHHADGHVLR